MRSTLVLEDVGICSTRIFFFNLSPLRLLLEPQKAIDEMLHVKINLVLGESMYEILNVVFIEFINFNLQIKVTNIYAKQKFL